MKERKKERTDERKKERTEERKKERKNGRKKERTEERLLGAVLLTDDCILASCIEGNKCFHLFTLSTAN